MLLTAVIAEWVFASFCPARALDELALPNYTRTANLLILKWTTAKLRSNTGCT